MHSAIALGKRTLTWSVVITTIAWSMGLSLLIAPLVASAAPAAGTLIKGSLPAVYYYAADGKRYVFPNEPTYKTWYASFSGVQSVTDAELAAISIGGNATYKPGVQMVKITTDPKVYAVAAGGTLRHVATEAVAVAIYGASWASMVHDVPDAFFVNYTIGAAVNAASDFDKAAQMAAATSIGVDKGIAGSTAVTPPVVVGPTVLSASLAEAGGGTLAPRAADAPVLKLKLVGTGTVTGLKVLKTGGEADANITGVKLYDGTTQLGTTQTLNASAQASFTGISIAVSGEKTITIAADIGANAGSSFTFEVNKAADITLSSGSVGGTFPLKGGTMTADANHAAVGTAVLYRGANMPTSDQNIDPDEQGFRFTQVRVEAGSAEDLVVKQIVAIQSGTVSTSDVKDIKLVLEETGATLAESATLPANGRVVFDGLSMTIPKGESRNFSVKASITGGSASNRTVGFDLHDGNAYTIRVVGAKYGFGITPTRNDFCATAGVTGGACQAQTVAQGTLRLDRASSSPATGNVAQGSTGVPLLVVSFTVTGEEVRITSQNWDFTFADDFVCTELTSVTLYDSKGAVAAGPKDCATNTITFTDTMTVPVGTNAYTLKANVASTAGNDGDGTADTVVATLDVSEFTAKGVQSGKVSTVQTTTDVAGNTLTVNAAALAATTLATPIAGNVIAGVQDYGFAKFTLDASAGGEDARIASIQVADATGAAALPGDLVNFELWGDADTSDSTDTMVRISTTNSTAAATYTANTAGIDSTLTFTFQSPLRLSKTKSATYEVRADILATAATGATATHVVDVAAVTATGYTTSSAITMTDGTQITGAGQAQTVAASGTLKVELAADRAVSGPIVAGSKGVSMTKYKLTAADEDVDVTQLPVFIANQAEAAGNLANVDTFKLYLNGTLIGNQAGYTFGSDGEKNVVLDSGVLRVVKDSPMYLEIKASFNAKEQVTSGSVLHFGIGDDDGDASSWAAAASATVGYNIVATGKDSGATIDQNDIDSSGVDGNTAGTIDGGYEMGVFDGVLAVGLDANSPSGVHTPGTGKEVFRMWATATGDEITVFDLEFINSGSAQGGDTNQVTGTGSAFLYNTDRSVTYADWLTANVTQPMDAGTGGIHVNGLESTTDDAGLDGGSSDGWDTALIIGAGETRVLLLVGDTTGAGGASSSKSLQTSINDGTATASGVQWMDVQLSGLNGTSCTAATTDLATANECVVDSATYTKTLPVNGNGLTYN
ncbi:MAG: hypothetical protein Q7S96_04710 [bacterium]|nr:hypothetical protein [bacterium]